MFYTFNTNKWQAAQDLYSWLKKHLQDYDEDHKEFEMDDGAYEDSKQIYEEMQEFNEAPPGGYEVGRDE
jgi:hypothetical protein